MPRKIGLGRRPRQFQRKEVRKAKQNEKLAANPKLTLLRPYCTVCKRFQTKEEEMNVNVYENDDSDIDDFYLPGHNRYSLFYEGEQNLND